ncbi:MAG: hypothetical protein JSU98_11485 [Gemmatimonadales bacterium]|nr:MAG: hypothetical protein JSU98_11485 [Gemmatimonadales bacterium]
MDARRLPHVAALLLLLPACQPTSLQVTVDLPADMVSTPQDGRLVVVFSQREGEPRFHVTDGLGAQPVFGVDVGGWMPGTSAAVPDTTFGFPVRHLADLPPGEYTVQALLNRYETFQRSDGRTVKLPPDRGEGQQWNRKPGNLYSTPVAVTITESGPTEPIALTLDQVIPPLPDPAGQETEWVKYVRIRSQRLSQFWGTDVYLGAWVLLPRGFDENSARRYPVAVFHGHFPASFTNIQTTPPDTTSPCVYSARFDLDCYNHVQERERYREFQLWNSDDFPRMLVVEIQHPTPFYDDSYAVNSANNGPYGDAITYELIPEIERRFNGIGEGWARFLYGGSTGGWEAMAAQVFYPDDYNGAWVACPDPIDFRAYTVVNLYEDENAYWIDEPFKRTARPGRRDWLGHVDRSLEESNHLELVLGTHTRSGQQWDVWESVYSPVGPDGYPARIWDKLTGEIDQEVAEYWRENYDLVHILRRDWATLGPKLQGKLHIYVGDMDNYYLNNAVYLAEDFLESTTDPYYAGEVEYGDRAEHCWNGDQDNPNAISRLRYISMHAPKIVDRLERTAPLGAPRGWRP